jgi:hypothetical protein
MSKSKEEIETIIIDFLKEHGEDYFTCAIATTCANGEVRNTPIDARNDGLNMYFSCDIGVKLENMKINPDVCLAIFIPVGKGYMKNARGLQMWGKAKIIDLEEDPVEFEKAYQVIRLDEIAEVSTGAPFPEAYKPKINFVKIVPTRISYSHSMGEKPEKFIWEA